MSRDSASQQENRRVAVVTGGARGIGDAVAVALAGDGMRIVVLDRIDPPSARPGVRYVSTDVTEPESVKEAFASVDDLEGRVDVLVHCAGVQRVGLVGKLSYEEWSAVVDTHLGGLFLCCSEAVPRMRAGAAIVTVASAAGIVGLPGRTPYSAAKAGMMGFVRSLAVELGSTGIRVNAVAPGYTRTALIQQAFDDGSQQEEWMLERVPLNRLAEPEDIAHVIAFLAGEQSAYVTGQTVAVDGGWTVQGTSTVPDWLDSTASRAAAS